MGKREAVYDSNELDKEVGTLVDEEPETEEEETEEEESEEAEEEDEEQEEESEEEPEAKKKDKKEDKEESEEDEESEEETEDEESEEESEEEEEESGETDDIDEVIKAKFGKDYEINSMDDLEQTLSKLDAVFEHNESLEKEVEELKKAKPKFETKAQEKAFEFIKDMPVTNLGEGLQTWAELAQMDVDATDPKLALRTQYIIKHPELTREEATRKFEKEYVRKYTVKPEDFDDDKERKEEEEDRKIDLKSDSAKAKEFLKKHQQSYKPESTKEEAPKVSEAVTAGIAKTTRAAEAFLKEYKSIEFTHKKDTIRYQLDEAKRNQIREAYSEWINNPASYNDKGEIPGFNPEKNSISFAFALFYEDIVSEIMRQVGTKTAVKRIEEIAETKPTRKAKGGDASRIPKSEEEQWDKLIDNKEKSKKKRK